MDMFEQGEKKNDCVFIHKNDYVGHDVLLTNMMNRPALVVMNEDLIKELMSPNMVMIAPKDPKVTALFYSVIGKGIVMIEGSEWKHRRKLLSHVFTHDFITALIPQMITVLDQVFEEFEKRHASTNK